MATFDFSPLYRSTVGFDQLFDMLAASNGPDWPPYNIERKDEDRYRISMALAGFRPDEIEVTQTGTTLLVTGQKKDDAASGSDMLHHGIAFRNFRQTFNLADHVKVEAANLEHGLLSVDLVREVPEQLKPRRIDIAGTSASNSTRVSTQKTIEQPADHSKKVA